MALSGWLQFLAERLSQIETAGRGETARADAAASADPGTPINPTVAPFDGVVYINDQIGNSYFQASGVLISPDEVLTASHVVYSTGEPVATNVEVSTGYNGTYSLLNSTGVVTHYNPINDANDNISFSASEQDYAIIHLNTPFLGTTLFSLMSNYADTLPSQTATAGISGYPENGNGAQIYYNGHISVDPGLTLYDGAALGPGSSGGPVWITNTDGEATAVGLVSSYDPSITDPTVAGNMLQITTPILNQIEAWVSEDDGTKPALNVLDTSNSDAADPLGAPYSGPVAGLDHQYLNITSDNINITANTNNWFLHSGSGEDALQARGGTNVLDGGTGSNFLVGGSGTDTFFTDDRTATVSIWDTIVNFHAGDAATIFGVTQSTFNFNWVNSDGAAGYTGLTLHATSGSKPEASVTFAGLTSSALTNGQLTISFGTTGGSSYMYISDRG